MAAYQSPWQTGTSAGAPVSRFHNTTQTQWGGTGQQVRPPSLPTAPQPSAGQQPQAAPQAPTGYQPQPPANMNVQGSIQPGSLYTPQQTQQAVNLARANAVIQGNPAWLQKQTDRRGVSRSAGTLAGVAPQMAQYQAQGAMAGAEIPFQDAQANAQFGLQGQQAQEGEINQLARLGLGFQNANVANQQSQQMAMLRLLGMPV